jgi:predicted RNA binding protein YcfA (HicA-like mRNA interferase family)
VRRKRLLQHLREHGCVVLRERGDHTKVFNPANGRRSVVGRHSEIEGHMVLLICKQLDIPPPSER